jgi:eukaryotic-like serine/threonine-protein kinase
LVDDQQLGVRHSWLQHEQLLQDFEAAWQRPEEPVLEEFLVARESPRRPYLLAELIKIDLECRWRRGRRALVEDYLARFPELCEGGQFPRDLLHEEIRVRRDCDQGPSWEELVSRFPDRQRELQETWDRGDETWPAASESKPQQSGLDESAPGKRLGRYELRQELGRGAFARVYLAWDPQLRREVAIKVPRAEFFDSELLRDRVIREAQSAARLHHPAIVSIHEVVAGEGGTFIVYEYVSGPTLASLLYESTPALRQIAQWVARLAEALDYAHQCGIIHRDVKPANVLLDQNGEPKLADFGLARQTDSTSLLTQEGDLLGTPAYMAPEQVRGQHDAVDARSDIYGLGVLLYEALAGRLPFSGTGVSIFQQILHDEPPPPRALRPSIPPDLETICLKALAKEPGRRYQTAGAMADDLRRYLEHRPILARRIGPAGHLVRWCRRQPAQAALAVALLVLAAGTLTGGLWYQQTRAARTAEVRGGIERAWSEANALAKEGARLRRQPAEWRALLASSLQALERAEQAAAGNALLVDRDLRERLARLRIEIEAEEKDRRMAARLDEILYHWSDIQREGAGYATVDRLPEYAAAFRDYGLPAVAMEPAAAARLIDARPPEVREQLLAALYAWHGIRSGGSDNPQELAWLGELLTELQPGAWEEKVVAAMAARDRGALEALAAEADPSQHSPRLLDRLAGALSREKGDEAAIGLLRRSLIHHANDFWLNHHLGSLLAGSDPPQLDEAIRFFTAGAALRPDDAGVFCNLGTLLHRAGQVDEAAICYQKSIQLNPKLALGYTNLANVLWAKGDLDGAVAQCRRAVAVSPELPVAHFSLGIALYRQGDLAGAATAYRRALQLDPKNAQMETNLGVVQELSGDSQGAIASFRSAIQHDPQFAMAHNNLGEVLAGSGEFLAAVAEFRQATRIKPDYAEAWCGLGLALRDLGQLDEALAALRRGHELGTAKHWQQPSAQWVVELERLVEQARSPK